MADSRPAPATLRRTPAAALVVVGAVLVAAASLLAWHTLRFDPQGWLAWGHQVVLGRGPFDTSAYPSWKPLAFVLAAPVALAGGAAPMLWLVAVRTAALLALVLAGRLAALRAGPVGGLLAVALLAASPGWWPTTLGGGIEPVIVLLGGLAVVAHERDRHAVALGLLGAMALGREEAVVVAVAYGLVLGRRSSPWFFAGAVAVAAGVAAAWLLGDWAGSGDPLHGAALARAAAPENPFSRFTAAETVVGLVVIPAGLALALAGTARAWLQDDRVLLAIAAAGLLWAAADAALLLLGYPVPARFVIPAAAAGAVAAGASLAAVRAPARRER